MKKKALLILTVALLATPCNGDDITSSSARDSALVTRISRNGLTQYEFFYDIRKRIYRQNSYTGGNFSTYTLYEYDDKGIKEMRRYIADDHSLIIRIVFTHDNLGRVIKADNYGWPEFADVTQSSKFEYNASGRLLALDYTKTGEPTDYREEYEYDLQGNLITRRRTQNPNQAGEYFRFEYNFTPTTQPLPNSWKDYAFILGIPAFQDDLRNMFHSQVHSKHWNHENVFSNETRLEFSGQVFDSRGNLVYQAITQKNLLHPENPDTVYEIAYDYEPQN
jgi:YD repeat-containing protein